MTKGQRCEKRAHGANEEWPMPEALFLNLRTQKIESHRPDRLTEPEQYVLLSDLLAE